MIVDIIIITGQFMHLLTHSLQSCTAVTATTELPTHIYIYNNLTRDHTLPSGLILLTCKPLAYTSSDIFNAASIYCHGLSQPQSGGHSPFLIRDEYSGSPSMTWVLTLPSGTRRRYSDAHIGVPMMMK